MIAEETRKEWLTTAVSFDNLQHIVNTAIRQNASTKSQNMIGCICEYETQRYFESIVPPERKEPFKKHLDEARESLIGTMKAFIGLLEAER